tara:strand:- start:71 stop:385 length:315 start_codon:yes stop_codon:yes gene_type:complete
MTELYDLITEEMEREDDRWRRLKRFLSFEENNLKGYEKAGLRNAITMSQLEGQEGYPYNKDEKTLWKYIKKAIAGFYFSEHHPFSTPAKRKKKEKEMWEDVLRR